MQFGDPEKLQTPRDFVAQKWRGVRQTSQRLFQIAAFIDADANQSVAFVGGDVETGDVGGGDARIGKLIADQFSQFLAQRFGDSFGAVLHDLFHPLDRGPHKNAAEDVSGLALHQLQNLLGMGVIARYGNC